MEYPKGSLVELKVNKLTSSKTQLPYQYYTLPYCQPKKIVESVENLGEILMGDIIENSPYELKMMVNTSCKELCKIKLTPEYKTRFQTMIEDEYRVNWMVDNLPGAWRHGSSSVANGFPVGFVKTDHCIYNHVTLKLAYHFETREYEGYRIVGFEVEPKSMKEPVKNQCDDVQPFRLAENKEITFTYTVEWQYSPIRWASRWDNYLKMTKGRIHWFSILNAFVIMLFLSGMVAMILLRTVHRDVLTYNDLEISEDAAEESGWKLVHGDVFRKPRFGKLFCVSVGSGVQILGMSIVVLFFAMLGFMSPAHRGAVLQFTMILFTFMGVFGGYVSSRLYKMFGGEDWKTMTVLMAFFFPTIVFIIFFVLNLMIWGQRSSGSVPFTTMFALLVLWFGISVPLVFLGAYFGFRKETIELPVRTNQIPRQIPKQVWYTDPYLQAVIGGLLPFAAVFTELQFILASVWQHQFYYLFGFLCMVLSILVITCAEVSIAFCYFHLSTEDYRWWWRSFFGSASSGLYVFAYSTVYFHTKLSITRGVSTILYFGYMGIMSLMFSLMTGAIGTIATLLFTRAIYAQIKID